MFTYLVPIPIFVDMTSTRQGYCCKSDFYNQVSGCNSHETQCRGKKYERFTIIKPTSFYIEHYKDRDSFPEKKKPKHFLPLIP